MVRKTLGKYEIIDRIGRGGMAEVYRGYHASLDRYVAIKLLHPFLADDPEFKDRFENEARNVAKLRHPNIVQVYDFEYDAEGDSYYMVMEFINGPTLKDRIFELGTIGDRFPVPETIRIVRNAAEALAYAHQRNMIHRDVKPANLMIDEDGRLVLTDFGIAKIVTGAQFTASGGMVGTPAYMAPEQGLGEAGDERSDIYSLGVILYQLITGRLPFDADTPLAIILKHVNEPVPNPRRFAPDLTDALEKIVCKVLEKEPTERYQTAIQFAQDLSMLDGAGNPIPLASAAAVGHSGTLQGPPETRPVITQEQRARLVEGMVQHLTGQIVLDSSLTVPDSIPTRLPNDSMQPVQQGAPGRLKPVAVLALTLALVIVVGAAFAVFGRDDRLLGSMFNAEDATRTPNATLTALAVLSTPDNATSPTREPDPTEIPARRPTTTTTPTLVLGPVARATETPEAPTASHTSTATWTPSVTPSRTPTLTRTPTPTRTATATATPTPNLTGTALVYFYETLAAATPTPNMTQTLAACDFQYIVVTPQRFNQPPSFNDSTNPRLVGANREFAFDIVLENVGSCAWPEGARLTYNEDLTLNPDGSVNLSPLTEVCGSNYTGLNFAEQERPNFFVTSRVNVTQQSAPIRFTGIAPNIFGCYYGVWDLLYPNSDITIGRPLVLTIRVWGGG